MNVFSPVFVLGVPRSGTTLLSVLLSNHPKVFLNEISVTGRLLKLLNLYNNHYLKGTFDNKEDFFQKIINRSERLKQLLNGVDLKGKCWREFLTERIIEKTKNNKKEIWLDKAPPFIDSIPEILFLFPYAKIIHIVRDPRANVLSLRERQYLDYRLAAKLWEKLNSKGISDGDIVNPDQYIIIKYEDLILETESVLKNICDFLFIDYDNKLIEKLKTSKYTNIENSYVSKQINVDKLRGWEKRLTKKEVKTIETITRNVMLNIGYELKYEPLNKGISHKKFYFIKFIQLIRDLIKKEKNVVYRTKIRLVKTTFKERFRAFYSGFVRSVFSEEFIMIFKPPTKM